jgi:hypothetical protein
MVVKRGGSEASTADHPASNSRPLVGLPRQQAGLVTGKRWSPLPGCYTLRMSFEDQPHRVTTNHPPSPNPPHPKRVKPGIDRYTYTYPHVPRHTPGRVPAASCQGQIESPAGAVYYITSIMGDPYPPPTYLSFDSQLGPITVGSFRNRRACNS